MPHNKTLVNGVVKYVPLNKPLEYKPDRRYKYESDKAFAYGDEENECPTLYYGVEGDGMELPSGEVYFVPDGAGWDHGFFMICHYDKLREIEST